MRYVSHSKRLVDYKADRTTLRLLLVLLAASILIFFQISTYYSEDVVRLFAGNRSATQVVGVEDEPTNDDKAQGERALGFDINQQPESTSAQAATTIPSEPVAQTTVASQTQKVVAPVVPATETTVVSETQVAVASELPAVESTVTPETQAAVAPVEPVAEAEAQRETQEVVVPTEPATENTLSQEPPAETAIPEGVYFNSSEEEIIRLLNEKRLELGLSQLTYDPNLAVSADIRAKEIVTLFSHTRPDGSAWNTAGYGIEQGENLAYGQATPSTAMADWMASPTHQANMLNSVWSIVAVSCYEADGVMYWVQHFA